MSQPRQSYPLAWPIGYKRTNWRQNSKFKQTFDRAQRSLHEEVRKLKGTDLIVSTDLRTRVDGYVYASDLDKLINDPGVAIYFKLKGKEVVMCCDKYHRVWENMYALACGIEALRGMDRWGVSEFLDRAFTGFTELPAHEHRQWYHVLGCDADAVEDEIKKRYRELVKVYHPDNKGTGNTEKFREIQKAYEEAIS